MNAQVATPRCVCDPQSSKGLADHGSSSSLVTADCLFVVQHLGWSMRGLCTAAPVLHLTFLDHRSLLPHHTIDNWQTSDTLQLGILAMSIQELSDELHLMIASYLDEAEDRANYCLTSKHFAQIGTSLTFEFFNFGTSENERTLERMRGFCWKGYMPIDTV